jgi:hypothetical protein
MIVLSGLVLLGGLAIMIGLADTQARKGAWRRIAAARRDQQERDRALRRCLEGTRCQRCPIDGYLHSGRS